MITLEKIRLIDQIRSRKSLNSVVTPKLASEVLRRFVVPLVSKEYNLRNALLTSPRVKTFESSEILTEQLKEELLQVQTKLSALKFKLKSVHSEKQKIEKEIQDLQNNCIKFEIVKKSLMFSPQSKSQQSSRKNSEKFTESDILKEYNTEKIIKENDSLRSFVESEHNTNDIRLIFLFFFNFYNFARTKKNFASVLQFDFNIAAHNSWQHFKIRSHLL